LDATDAPGRTDSDGSGAIETEPQRSDVAPQAVTEAVAEPVARPSTIETAMSAGGQNTAEHARQATEDQPAPAIQHVDAKEPPAEQPGDRTPETAVSSGVTSSGRAVNDPRVSPSPVGDVHIETARMVLFAENPVPPVEAPDRNVPRASNDPRGPRGQGADEAESA
jgi:ribonuclease E